MDSEFLRGQRFICKKLISFINSLPNEPVSEGLEEAAEEYTKLHVTIFPDGSTDRGNRYRAFKAGSEWQKRKDIEMALERRNKLIYG